MNTSIGNTATGNSASYKHQRGYLLLPVAVTLTLVATIAYLISQEGALESNMAKGEAQATQLQYLTEAGLNHALWRTERNYCEGSFSIPATAMGADNYSATINGTGSTTKYSLPVSQDAWIRNDNPTTNNGSANTQHIRNEEGKIEQALYQFDLSSLNAGTRIHSAFAWFYIDQQHPKGAISAHRINADWVDSTVTWDNFGAAFDSATLAIVPPQDQSDNWVAFNITSQVQAWVNGETNNGIALASTAEGVHARYMSLEGTAGQKPRLEVVTGTAPATALDIEATGTLANGVSRSLSRKQVQDYQGPSEAFVQFSASIGEDAHIDNFYDTRNFGGTDFLQVSSDPGWTTRSLLRFEPGAIPAGSRIMSARLQLKLKSVRTGGKISVHRPERNWVEGTKVGGGIANGVNWFTYDDSNSNSWSNTGGDYGEAISSTDISSSDNWVAFDITPLMREWMAGQTNNGVMLVGNSPLDEAEFESRTTAITTDAPRVTIRFNCPCNSACSIPQGSGNILLVVGVDSPVPGPNDNFKKALFESWGYNVTLLNDNAGQTSFDNAFAVNDVVYVSETISSNDLANKVVNAPIGVVNEQGTQNDNLGFESANSSNWPVGDTLTISDNSHEITRGFPSGPLTLYDNAMGGLAIDNTPSPNLQPLANWGTATGLAVLEASAAMANGGNTTSRRVMLPFGRDSNMDWSKVNNNGHLLLQRAIKWASGSDVDNSIQPGLWLSTLNDVTVSGAPGLDSWTAGEAIALTDPSLSFEPGISNGTFSSIMNLDDFAADNNATIDAMHYVTSATTVGNASSMVLLTGDILLSTEAPETLSSTSSLSVGEEDVFVFRPDSAGNYSTGSFIFLIDGSSLHEANTVGVSLVEQNTAVGDGLLTQGSFLMAITNRRDVIHFSADNVGPGTTSGSFTEFIDGPSLSLGSEIRGMELAETAINLGGQTIPAGSILLTLNNDDGDGVGDNEIPADSTDIFYLTVSQVGANPIANATLLLQGLDLNLDTSGEHLQSLSLVAAQSVGVAPKNLLFVVGNDTNLTPEETQHQILLVAWDYNVELIDDDASQAEFNTAASNNDVAFVTNGITASRLSTKLVNATIGVVTSEDNLSDEFGLSASIAWDSGSILEINDNSHYITSPFSLGPLTVFNTSESLAYVTGTLSPGLRQLASSTSGFGVVTLEAGATMFGGSPAAGRRVQLPWGGNGFYPKNLTQDGRTILQRALEWSWGSGGEDEGEGGGGAPETLITIADNSMTEGKTNNYGGSQLLLGRSGGKGMYQRSLLRFDLASIPAGAVINSATLRLFASNRAGSDAFNLEVYRMTQDWLEMQAHWFNADSSTPWSNGPGGSYDVGVLVDSTPVTADGWYEWDLKPLVQEWVDNINPNQGIELIPTTVARDNYLNLDSREMTNPPELIIDYTPL